MAFHLRTYTAPDFSKEKFISAPDVVLKEAPVDMAAPENFHALSIFPEYFKINGKWLLAEDSRMDCVPVYKDGKVYVIEPRHLKKGDLVVVGRTEDCQDGIYVHANGFGSIDKKQEVWYFLLYKCRTYVDRYNKFLRRKV